MKSVLNYLGGDKVIWVITMLMVVFSLVTVYSFVPILVKMSGGSAFKHLITHSIYVLMSLGIMVWVYFRDPKYISKLSKFAFYVAIGLMVFTFFFGAKVNGAGRWVRIPFVGLTFQSSDFARLALIIYVSRLLVKGKDKVSKLKDWKDGFLKVVLPIVVMCALIVKDNFSTAAILFGVSMVVLFVGRMHFAKIMALIGGGLGLFLLVVGIHLAVPQLNILPRWDTWVNRYVKQVDDDVNVIENAQAMNARLAIYNGGPTGQGVGDGKLKSYLPEAYADFYYSSFVEEFGSISAFILVLLYLILLYRIMRIGLNAKDDFHTYVCIGIGVLMLSQAAVNMLVCTGLAPVTGQNMPLLAMGGSAMMMTCLALGIVQSIAKKQESSAPKETDDDMILETA